MKMKPDSSAVPSLKRAEPALATPGVSEPLSLLVNIYVAAAILGLTENRFRGCIARGEIVVTKKIGNAFFFSRKYLASWAEKAAA